MCSEVAAAPAPAPTTPPQQATPPAAPDLTAQDMPPDEDTTAAGPSQPPPPPGPTAQLPPALPELPPPARPAPPPLPQEVTPAPAAPVTAPPAPATAGAAAEAVPFDGRSAVAGFYGALGRGDGIDAARFLIPEKRGRGPFSAAAMERFYGGLKRPLRLTDVRQVGTTTLRARYTFVTQAGAVCNGDSVVAVRPTREGALIESIRALSGC